MNNELYLAHQTLRRDEFNIFNYLPSCKKQQQQKMRVYRKTNVSFIDFYLKGFTWIQNQTDIANVCEIISGRLNRN